MSHHGSRVHITQLITLYEYHCTRGAYSMSYHGSCVPIIQLVTLHEYHCTRVRRLIST